MDIENNIIQEYINGASILSLEKKYYPTYNYRQIKKILINNNITIRGGRKKKQLSDEQWQYIEQKYCQEGENLYILAQQLNMDKATLRNLINEKQLTKKTSNKINKNLIEDYFSVIDSEEKAYFLGLLLTDGCVDKKEKRSGRIRLQLQAIDKNILLKFKEALHIDSKLVLDPRGNQCYSIEFTSEKMFNDLAKYNIVPNKTYVTTHLPTNIPNKFLKDFLRGMVDGDGSITFGKDMSKDVSLNFTSYHESFVLDFQAAVDSLLGKEQHTKVFFTSAWHCQWRGYNQVMSILNILYKDANVYIERKYNSYQKLLSRN